MSNSTFDDQPVAELGQLDLRAVFSTLWRGKFLLVLGMLLGGICGGLYAWKMVDPEFHASAIIEFSSDDGGSLDISSFVRSSSLDTSAVNTQLASLRTHEAAVELVKLLDLTNDAEFNPLLRDPSWKQIAKSYLRHDILGAPKTIRSDEDTERLAQRLTASVVRSKLSISAPRDARLITVTARSVDPVMASQMANSLSEIYIKHRQERQLIAAQDALTWLSEQVRDLQDDLAAEESNLKDLLASSENITAERLVVLGAQTSEFEKLLLARRLDLEEAARDLAVATQSQDESQLAAARAQVATIEQDVQSLSAAYNNMKRRFSDQSGVIQEIGESERKIAVIDNLYKTLLTGLQETTIYAGQTRADTFMMSHALPALQPTTPNVSTYAVLAATLTGALLAVLMIWRTHARKTIKSMQELQRLFDIPVFGETLAVKARKRWDVIEHLRAQPTSAFSETLRNLRTSIFLASNKPPQVILLTSSIPGEGKTSISIMLALSISQLGKKVLVIEGDVRKGTFAEFLPKSERGSGLTSVVAENSTLSEATRHNALLEADILVGGQTAQSPADIFSSKNFEKLINDARATYDHIIIDTPPVSLITDARIIARFVDQVLYVVRWDHTQISNVRDALDTMASAAHPVDGLILSQVNPKKQRRYGYGTKYGKYGRQYYT